MLYCRYKAGQKEAGILRRLAEADPHDKKHIVRMDRVFEHRKHLCLVFESLRLARSSHVCHIVLIISLTQYESKRSRPKIWQRRWH